MTDPKTTPAQGSAPAQTTPSTTPSAPAPASAPPADPTKAAVLQGLTIAASIATGIAALPIPYAQTIAAVVAGLLAVTRGIVERWGMQGLAAAKQVLEELHARGPAAITDAELAADDAALLAEIHGWYPAQAAVVDERIARAGTLTVPANPYGTAVVAGLATGAPPTEPSES